MLLLYHYTCDHGDKGIREDGVLRGNVHPWMRAAGPIVWLTDMEVPDARALGLTSFSLSCDRTAHQFGVDTDQAEHWPVAARRLCTPAVRRGLDFAPGARPMHWWVFLGPELVPNGWGRKGVAQPL